MLTQEELDTLDTRFSWWPYFDVENDIGPFLEPPWDHLVSYAGSILGRDITLEDFHSAKDYHFDLFWTRFYKALNTPTLG